MAAIEMGAKGQGTDDMGLDRAKQGQAHPATISQALSYGLTLMAPGFCSHL